MKTVSHSQSNSSLATKQQLRRANNKKSTSTLDSLSRALPSVKTLAAASLAVLVAPALFRQAKAAPVGYGLVPRDTTYTVVAGDSLSGIAGKEGVSLSALEAANPQVTDVNLIQPGQVITVPGASPAMATGTLSNAQAAAEIDRLQGEINSLQGDIATATSPAEVQSLQQEQSAAMASENAVYVELQGQAAPTGGSAPAPAPAPSAAPASNNAPAPSAAPTPAPLAPQPQQAEVSTAPAAPAPTGGSSSGSSAVSSSNGGAPAKGSLSLSLTDSAPQEIKQWASEINAAAAFFNVPADLIGAVIYQESTGNAGSLSTNPGNGLTDAGLMQVNPDTQAQVISENPSAFSGLSGAAENIMAGTGYLRDQFTKFGSWPKALRAYNSGPSDPSLTSGDLTATALGDPTYIAKVSAWWVALSTGQNLPSDYNPAEVHT